MKIERAESKFQPVVITLESQEEVDCLLICLNNSGQTFENNAASIHFINSDRVSASKKLFAGLYFQLEKFCKI